MGKPIYLRQYENRMPQKNEILKILTEAEARRLQPSTTVNIGVIIVVPRIINKKVQVMTIVEDNSFNLDWPVTKIPSGGMELMETDFETTALREGRGEGDHHLKNFVFVVAAEYSSTIEREKHYKICVIAKKHIPRNIHFRSVLKEKLTYADSVQKILFNQRAFEKPKLYFPTEAGIRSVNWTPIEVLEKTIPKGQRILLQPVIDKLQGLSYEYWNAVGEMRIGTRFMEGTYHVNTYGEK